MRDYVRTMLGFVCLVAAILSLAARAHADELIIPSVAHDLNDIAKKRPCGVKCMRAVYGIEVRPALPAWRSDRKPTNTSKQEARR